MATLREIKRKIKSVDNISQITKAVQMVAASKMRKSQEQAKSSKPYSLKMEEMLKDLAIHTDPELHPLLQKGEGEKTLVLFIAPSRGLCGPLLSSLKNTTYQFIKENKSKNLEFILIGEKGEDILLKVNQNIIAEFNDLPDQPLFTQTLPISHIIIDGFKNKKYKRVVSIYTKFNSTLSQETDIKQILPLEQIQEDETITDYYMLYEPEPAKILGKLLPYYVELITYHLVLESLASEHSARMIAMKNATDNALDMLDSLTLEYNQARQAAITQEVNEISASKISMGGV